MNKHRIFTVCLITCIIINMDHGVLPACTFEMKKELGIEDFFLGILGSTVFAGLMIGSLVSGYLFTRFICKKIIIVSLANVLIGLILFPLSGKNQYLMIFSRFLSGFFQVFLTIYIPVWVDKFGGVHSTSWISYI